MKHYILVVFPQTVLRIWDCLFYEGSKILFRVALTLIHHNQALIEQAKSLPDVCQAFKEIAQGPFVEDCHPFMQVRGRWAAARPIFAPEGSSFTRDQLAQNKGVVCFISASVIP